MREATERNAEIMRLREEEHWTYERIGYEFWLSRERVCQIVHSELRRRNRPRNEVLVMLEVLVARARVLPS